MSQSALPRRKLGELLRIKHGYAFRGEYFAESGPYIVVTPGNFRDEGGFKQKDGKEKCYVGPVPDGYVLKRGKLVVVMTEQAEGLLGSAAWIPEDDLYLHNQRIGLITAVEERELHAGFLYYLLNDRSVRAQIRASAGGTKVRHTSPSRIYEVEIGLPPLREQRRIAAILSAYDDLIENNLRRIKILERMAQAIHREWFVHFRFPGHEKAKMVDSPLGHLPQGWQVRQLPSLAEFSKGRKPKVTSSEHEPGTIPLILIDVMRGGQPVFTQPDGVVLADRRDIIMVMDGASSGEVAMGVEGAVGSTLARLRRVGKGEVSVHALYLFLKSRREEISSRNVGAAIPHANKDYIASMPFAVPPPNITAMFDNIAEPLQGLSENLKAQNALLRTARDLLLPRLLSGELDVSDLEIAMPEVAA